MSWWERPRSVQVVVDNESWILPYAEELADAVRGRGDSCDLRRSYDAVRPGDVTFFLGCVRIADQDVLSRSRRNLVVHESDLPRGRGFAPLTWQVLEGMSEIPVCLVEAGKGADEGPVVLRDSISLDRHDLNPDLRHKQGEITKALCLKYLDAETPPLGEAQVGTPGYYRKRTPEDSRLDPYKAIADQFNLLRVVDNDRYPAFFDLDGQRYRIRIDKVPDTEGKDE